nr:hypothetical protein [Pseudonocardia ammonioxydans]
MTSTGTGQTNRLKALLRDGDDTDKALARGKLSDTDLNTLARGKQPREATRAQAVRHGELRRLAVALREQRRELKSNRAQLQTIVHDLAPGLTGHKGIGPVCAAQAIVSFSHPGRAVAARPRSPPSAAPARSRPAADAAPGIGSTSAATAP